MRAFSRKPATYEDLAKLSQNVVGELVGGELFASPRPASSHAHAASVLGMDLGGPFQRGRGGPGGWWILYEPELHLNGDVMVPDLSGWRRERLPNMPDAPYFTLPPDWICEILSPSTARLDRMLKMPAYARAGVPFAWIVDPHLHALDVFKLKEGNWSLIQSWAGEEVVKPEPFEAVPFELGALWISKPEE